MKSRLFRLASIAALLLPALNGCQIPFELDHADPARMYVQCIPSDGQTVLQVLYAAPAYGNSGTIFDFHASDVTLQVNGQAVPMREDEDADGVRDGRFVTDVPLKEGDAVSVSVSGPEVPTVTGSTVIPRSPKIVGVSHEDIQLDTISGTRVTLSLDRIPGEEDYYGVQIIQRMLMHYVKFEELGTDTVETYITPGQMLSIAEVGSVDMDGYVQVNYTDGLLGRGVDAPMRLLKARQFEGQQYSCYLNSLDASMMAYWMNPGRLPGWLNPSGGDDDDTPEDEQDGEDDGVDPDKLYFSTTVEYNFIVCQLSPELFHYGKALYHSNFDFLSNLGLTPANFTYSNISGGLGVVGALSRTETGFIRLGNANPFRQ
ncbi:MAG: DUF4249 family protein [Bacteroidales bacterium]|nr:DUF4249 family protein [Bacteroidales bacterium]